MTGPQRTSTGFSLVALLVAIVAVGLIGAAGWFVYQHNRPKEVRAAGNTQTSTQQTTTAPTTTYLTINEWGLRAPYAGSLKLSYTISADGTTAWFSADQLTALSSACVGRGGAIERFAPTDYISPYQQGPTAEQAAVQNPSLYIHIGGYYYLFLHTQTGCGDLNTTSPLQAQTNDAVKALLAGLQAIPN